MKTLLQRSHRCILCLVALVLLLSLPGVPVRAATQSYLIQASSAAEAARLVRWYGGSVASQLEIVDAVSAELSDTSLAQLRSDPAIRSVTLNRSISAAGYAGLGGEGLGNDPATDYADTTGADLVWETGTTGDGVTVAVLDTGIGPLQGLTRGLAHQPRIVGWVDMVTGRKAPFDDNGHGSHIAGIIANTQMGSDGEWNGMAPGVDLVGVRVLDKNGYGTYEQVINGLQWVLEHKDEYNIKVVNLSLVSEVKSPYWADLLNQAVMQAWASGLTVVVAAGNTGPGPMSIGVPGNTPYVITVGAFTDSFTPKDWTDDKLADFSAAGPTLDGFAKPDLVAPGAHMVSTMLPSTKIAREHDLDRASSQYFSMAGTSQAAAVTSGVAALILSKHPELTPDQVKYRLMLTALPWADPDPDVNNRPATHYSIWQQGAGRLNALDAVMSDDPILDGQANLGMDILADLDGVAHYEGYSFYNAETGQFELKGDLDALPAGFGAWSGGFGAWSGGFGAWSGGFGAWSGGFGAWSGGFGAWSGGFGAWSGGFGAWSGGFGAWSGGFGAWSGSFMTSGFGAWSGGFGAWSGGFGAWSGGFGAWSGSTDWDEFVEGYVNGPYELVSLDSTATIDQWVPEP